jgi:hypothetical protein
MVVLCHQLSQTQHRQLYSIVRNIPDVICSETINLDVFGFLVRVFPRRFSGWEKQGAIGALKFSNRPRDPNPRALHSTSQPASLPTMPTLNRPALTLPWPLSAVSANCPMFGEFGPPGGANVGIRLQSDVSARKVDWSQNEIIRAIAATGISPINQAFQARNWILLAANAAWIGLCDSAVD